ncbi:hypothetical protein BDDG_08803 [Blastomyces dermatitidis ATCC 18188]|uniref:Uncharacterized protein n=1 Tax=Ajellomyces dermatitidis (strain ATCC 18188 / CBS 674.68) TaxID=653446 RepID=F2TRJ5_AJEDA|nr:hypothetical protein BDDG_08803 [Blastomyces dermatitidis ATCC 18188]
MSSRKIFRTSDERKVIDQINYLNRDGIRRVLKRLFQSLSQKEHNALLEAVKKTNKIKESESHSSMSKVDSRSDEEKTVVSCHQSARLHGQKVTDESVKKSENRSSKDSDVTAERFKQKFSDRDTDAEAATEDKMKSVAQIEVKVKSAVEDIYEKKDEEKLKLTEADK